MKHYIYFDNAATTLPKPECVRRAVSSALDTCGNPGRSAHVPSLFAAERVYDCRKALCRLFGTDAPERVIFTGSATLALNMAIKGYAKDGSHILISNLEHNAVIRPVHALSLANRGITYDFFDATGTDEEIVEAFENGLHPDTAFAAVTLASNVSGRVLPVRKIAAVCKKRGILLVCDVSQAAGALPVNASTLGADVLCFAGHKSLYGPPGTGGMLIMTDVLPKTVIEGGSGIMSASRTMEGGLPEYLEAGTLAVPSITGLCAAVGYLSRLGIGEIAGRDKVLIDALTDRLESIRGVTLYGVDAKRTATIAFNVDGVDSEQTASLLGARGMCVRGGMHCAPMAHDAYHTGEGGAVRASLTFTNTLSEIDAFASAVADIAGRARQ